MDKGRYPQTAALIHSARLRKGLSQEKAAVLAGCSRLQFIRWEQGLHRPEGHRAEALVAKLGVDADKLSAADPEPDEDDLMAPLSRAIRDLVRSELERAR